MSDNLFAFQIHHKNIPNDGLYILIPFNIFKEYITVRSIDGLFYYLHENNEDRPIPQNKIKQYSHYVPYDKDIDIDNTPIERQEIIDYSSVLLGDINELGFLFEDRSGRSFIMYQYKDSFCMDVMEYNEPECMYEGQIGWHKLNMPDDSKVLNQVQLNEKELKSVIASFKHFKKTGYLPNDDQKTSRGFNFREFTMQNNEVFTLQESSSAMADCIWMGVAHPSIQIGKTIFKDQQEFVDAAYNGFIKGYPMPSKIKHCNLPSRIEISTYYVDPMLKIMDVILGKMKEFKK